MADNVPNEPARHFQFVRAGDASAAPLEWGKGEEQVRKALGEALNARNVAFLLGAGCSSLMAGGTERGVPTMAPLAKEFCVIPAPEYDDDFAMVPPPAWAIDAEDVEFLARIGAKLDGTDYARNLERLMELLHSLRVVFTRSDKPDDVDRAVKVDLLIKKVQDFLLERCTNGAFAHGDGAVLELYESFYRKLVMRDRSLPAAMGVHNQLRPF